MPSKTCEKKRGCGVQWTWSAATFVSVSIALLMLAAMLGYARHRRLLFMPENNG